MKILINKKQWQQIGKTAGWIYNMCSYCGNPIEKPDGQTDEFCRGVKCITDDPSTPTEHKDISDGVCQDCFNKGIYMKQESEFPYNINKGTTPKDVLMKHIQSTTGKKQITQDEINEIFNKNITSALKLINYKIS